MADLRKDTLLFAKERRRMCETVKDEGKACAYSNFCTFCEFFPGEDYCDLYGEEHDEHVLDVVQRWHDEHPERPKPRKEMDGQIEMGGELNDA